MRCCCRPRSESGDEGIDPDAQPDRDDDGDESGDEWAAGNDCRDYRPDQRLIARPGQSGERDEQQVARYGHPHRTRRQIHGEAGERDESRGEHHDSGPAGEPLTCPAERGLDARGAHPPPPVQPDPAARGIAAQITEDRAERGQRDHRPEGRCTGRHRECAEECHRDLAREDHEERVSQDEQEHHRQRPRTGRDLHEEEFHHTAIRTRSR